VLLEAVRVLVVSNNTLRGLEILLIQTVKVLIQAVILL
jgi:hypothetical protein